MDRKPSKFLRVQDTHPTMLKFQDLMDAADKLGLWLEFGHDYCLLHDRANPDVVYHLYDLDYGSDMITEFPPTMDYKVIIDNPAYQEWEKQENQKRDRDRAEAIRLAEEKAKKIREDAEARRQEQARLAAIELENMERAELVRLKNKYER